MICLGSTPIPWPRFPAIDLVEYLAWLIGTENLSRRQVRIRALPINERTWNVFQ